MNEVRLARSGAAIVLLLLAGACSNTPTNGLGLPWWPNQPGAVPEGVNEPDAYTRTPASTRPASAADAPASSAAADAPARPDAAAMTAAATVAEAPQAAPVVIAAATPAAPASPAAVPVERAPNRYVQTARYGDLVFVSGQIALDLRTNEFVDGPVARQAAQALGNVQELLAAEGLTMANVVEVTVYLKDLASLKEFETAYGPFFKGRLPARSVVEVAALPRGALVEVAAIAGR